MTMKSLSFILHVCQLLLITLLLYPNGALAQQSSLYLPQISNILMPDRPFRVVAQAGITKVGDDCGWKAGVLAWGNAAAWKATGDVHYWDLVKQWVDGCLAQTLPYAHVNDVPRAYAALIVYERNHEPQYLAEGNAAARFVLEQAPRTADGTLIHLADMVWDDTLMGVIPFLVEMHQVTGDPQYLDAAADQVLRHAAHLQNGTTGLYHHAWSEPLDALSGPSYWGRGNGWVMAATVELLAALPSTHPAYAQVLANYRQQAVALAKLQDSSGQWHTVVNRSDFYLESSGSALIAAGLAAGAQHGWLDSILIPGLPAILTAAERGVWQAVAADGLVQAVSGPTGPMEDEEAYNQIDAGAVELYGQGAVLLAGAALLNR
jgi:unsaturated rhamnogalacturonyl hydrolase